MNHEQLKERLTDIASQIETSHPDSAKQLLEIVEILSNDPSTGWQQVKKRLLDLMAEIAIKLGNVNKDGHNPNNDSPVFQDDNFDSILELIWWLFINS